MRERYYINSRGEKIDFSRWPYRIKSHNLQRWEWDYDAVNTGNIGGSIRRIYRGVKEFTVTITVCSLSPQNRMKDITRLYEILEYDTHMEKMGKFYIGKEYMTCFFTRSEKRTNPSITNALDITFTVVSPYPMWCRDESVSFYQLDQIESNDGLNYPYNYPYNYTANLTVNYLQNTNDRPDDFEMIVYGPVVHPRITIGKNEYYVKAEILTGEYMVINSRKKEIYKILGNGDQENMFNSRVGKNGFFAKIPPGKNLVTYSGTFGFDITIFHERSEPDWTLS